jgi:hypothetical protein
VGIVERVGPENVVACCMDGACVSSFPLIVEAVNIFVDAGLTVCWQVNHIFCFICPTHSLDNFLKNVCSDADEITVKSVRTGDDEKSFEWGSTVFSRPIEHAWDVIKFVTHHAKPLACFRTIAKDPSTWVGQSVPKGCELLKFCDTRFASKLLMLARYLRLRPVLEQLVANPAYKAWLGTQRADIKDTAEVFLWLIMLNLIGACRRAK